MQSESGSQGQGSDFWLGHAAAAGSEENRQIWGARLGSEVPVVPGIEMAAEARGVEDIPKMSECQVRKKAPGTEP